MSAQREEAPREILLVEDNPGDIDLVLEALSEAPVETRVTCAGDAAEAMSRLRGEAAPDLIMLDLNLPDRSGHDVLVEIKSDPRLKHIPVIIFSSSDAKEDVEKAYEHFANCYVTKPVELPEFLAASEMIVSFWFRTAKVPGADSSDAHGGGSVPKAG